MRDFKLKESKYCLMEEHLYWRDPSGILFKCVSENES